LDSHFNLIEEKQEALVLENSLIIQQTKQSSAWCTECDVYIIIVTVGDRRLYVTTSASNYNDEVGSSVVSTATVLRNQIECYSYTVLSKDKDLIFDVNNYQGNIDLFVAALFQPSTTTSSSVKLLSKVQKANHHMIVRELDRSYWGAVTGNYFLCGQAYSGTSMTLQATESYLGSQVNGDNGMLYSFWLYNDDYMNFELTVSELRSQSLDLHIDLGIYDSTNQVRKTEVL
jgi:hypothetical protein